MSKESCYARAGAVCEHSQFCGAGLGGGAGSGGGERCNVSTYLCITQEQRCDGHLDCLPGDLSDEVGCYLPYVMASPGGVVLSLVVAASSACVYQHHHMISQHGMTRYKQDLVRRKDKVKARNAENKRNNKTESSSSSADAKEMSSLAPLAAPAVAKPPAPAPVPVPVSKHSTATGPLSASSLPGPSTK